MRCAHYMHEFPIDSPKLNFWNKGMKNSIILAKRFLVGELLTLINVVSLCFIFLRIYIFCKCVVPSISMSASFAYIALPWHLFLHLTFNATASHLHGTYSYIAHAPLLFLHHKFSCFPFALFYIILFFYVLICSWNQCLVVSLTLLYDLCKFLYSFVLVLHVSNFLGFFLFDVLCRCNFFGFYITYIVLVSFSFSFLSFVVFFFFVQNFDISCLSLYWCHTVSIINFMLVAIS
jgi:hypothetical protein